MRGLNSVTTIIQHLDQKQWRHWPRQIIHSFIICLSPPIACTTLSQPLYLRLSSRKFIETFSQHIPAHHVLKNRLLRGESRQHFLPSPDQIARRNSTDIRRPQTRLSDRAPTHSSLPASSRSTNRRRDYSPTKCDQPSTRPSRRRRLSCS